MQSPSMFTATFSSQPSSTSPSQSSSIPLSQTSGGVAGPHAQPSHGPQPVNSPPPLHVCVPFEQLGSLSHVGGPPKQGCCWPPEHGQSSSTKPSRSLSRPSPHTSADGSPGGGSCPQPLPAPPPPLAALVLPVDSALESVVRVKPPPEPPAPVVPL